MPSLSDWRDPRPASAGRRFTYSAGEPTTRPASGGLDHLALMCIRSTSSSLRGGESPGGWESCGSAGSSGKRVGLRLSVRRLQQRSASCLSATGLLFGRWCALAEFVAACAGSRAAYEASTGPRTCLLSSWPARWGSSRLSCGRTSAASGSVARQPEVGRVARRSAAWMKWPSLTIPSAVGWMPSSPNHSG
jgi:hypothetical protein